MARIDTVLIANRGEIACRVIRACRETGRRAVAVYSDPDQGALHTRLADEAVRLGPASPAQSYLDVQKVIAAAKQTGAQAIHPGYGFLSEQEHAARAVEEAGLIWIGPTADVIAALGDKVQARAIALEAGVPVIPGSDGAVTIEQAKALAPEIGFPVLLKAAGGGGGKGIRMVESAETLASDLERAAGEAQSAFGTSAVYLEKCVFPARHVEVQVVGDGQGDAVHLGERECSLQRRQQKVLEETPSPGISGEIRRALGEAAVKITKAAHYRGAGTVEFLVDDAGGFYFLEVNARLQVEHPITEMVTGVDLVRTQLHVAETGTLPMTQADWQPRGHAFELRVNAEDPFQGWVPSIGTVRGLELPAGPFVRVDTGLCDGDEVTPYYDSLLAKLVVWGRDREQALERLLSAVRAFRISGLSTTLPLVPLLAADEEFRAGKFHTAWLIPWLEQHLDATQALEDAEAEAAAVAVAVAEHQRRQGRGPGAASNDAAAPAPPAGPSPWVLAGRPRGGR